MSVYELLLKQVWFKTQIPSLLVRGPRDVSMPAPEELLCPAYIHYSLVPWSSEHSDTSRVYRANRGAHFDTSHELRRFTDPASSTASILMGPAPLQSLLSRRCGQFLFAAFGVLEVLSFAPRLTLGAQVRTALVDWSEVQFGLALFVVVLLGQFSNKGSSRDVQVKRFTSLTFSK